MLATRRQEPCPLTYWDRQKALPSRPAPGVPTASGVSSSWKRCGWRPCRSRALASASERAMLGGIALRFVDGAMAISTKALRLSASTLVVGSRPQAGLCDACQVAALDHCFGWARPVLSISPARKTGILQNRRQAVVPAAPKFWSEQASSCCCGCFEFKQQESCWMIHRLLVPSRISARSASKHWLLTSPKYRQHALAKNKPANLPAYPARPGLHRRWPLTRTG